MMKLIAKLILVFAPLSAYATPLTYDITSYASGNYSASWLHSAEGCQGGPNNDLYMCSGNSDSSFLYAITSGRLSGDYVGGELTGITGYLHTNSTDPLFDAVRITGGRLGGNDWFLDYELDNIEGRFWFEQLNMGGPNSYTADAFILWGQNSDAYVQALGGPDAPYNEHFMPIGVDLYAVQVPEPATWLLLGSGLAGLILRRRRIV